MTSLALVPSTFPVLKLPFVALQVVADCLNPFEIYHFSRISKRTKRLAKVFSKKATRIFLISPSRVAIEFKESENWSIEPIIEPGPDFYSVDNQREPIYGFFSENPASEVLEVLEQVVDIFKNSNVHLHFCTEYSKHKDLISYFNWFMENPSEVPLVNIKCTSAEDVLYFIKNYKKPTEQLCLILKRKNGDRWFEDRKRLKLTDNLETNLFKKVKIQNYKPVNLNLYNIFSSPFINSVENQLTNQDLNTLIKNWQSGLTNSHWRSVCISVRRQTNLINILDGIKATYRDPRTVKRQINMPKESFWIFGGIDIQKYEMEQPLQPFNG
ncbi:unnamed protein product [Caenorhabditis brenneri]